MICLSRGFAMAGLLLGVAACQPGSETDFDERPFDPEYGSISTELLEDDLVSFTLQMRGARDNADIKDFGDCAAAQYAVIRGYGFARHIRTTSEEFGGLWTGKGVYTISAGLPRGLATIDAEVTLANCRESGIPTV